MPQEDVMNATKLDAYRQRLRTLAQRLQGDARSIEEEARGASEGDNSGDLSHVPFHLADRATDELLVGLNATYLENSAKLLEETLASIRRIDDGSFGKCERCGKAIGAARLDAIPFARTCIDCAKLEDDARPNLDNGRPRGPEDTVQPEGYMNEQNRREGSLFAEMSGRSPSAADRQGDRHATGTPGGGTAFGGLAGTNTGRGDPDVAELSDAHANGESDLDEAYQEADDENPRAGHAGGAVGGTPVNKRSRPRE